MTTALSTTLLTGLTKLNQNERSLTVTNNVFEMFVTYV
jgi:hypothetical protein